MENNNNSFLSFIITWFILCLFNYETLQAQPNEYGLLVIKTKKEYKQSVAADSLKRMVDIKQYIPGIQIDLRYSTENNFMHTRLYPLLKTTYVRLAAAQILLLIQNELKQKGLSLKIFDAYRPYHVTVKMWEPVKDSRYAADPKFGSGHNRGIAIDLTIVHSNNLMELNMGTDFDNFTDTAHHNFKNLNPTILQNRALLKTIMEKYGFIALDTEWWHYYLPNAKTYELMNLSFNTLKKLSSIKLIH
ncbi:MAG: M15 family metallopeptidase [Niastella sp.]|nr:M15 family metallopeptidase [Niastella sp.]